MANDIKVGDNKFVSMTTDFGHSAIGRLGGRKVQVGQGQQPRLKFGPIVKGKGFLARLANWMTSKSRRVESKVLAGLQDFSKSVGNTLGSLIPREDGKPDMKNLLSDLASLRREAEPITKRGTDFQELLKARVGMELTRLSETGLKNLLTVLESEEMQDFRFSLSEGPNPEQLRVMDAMGEGETLQAKTRQYNDMAEDLEAIRGLVQAEAENRLGKEMGVFREMTAQFFEHEADPAEDPGLFGAQMEDLFKSYDTIAQHANSMNADLPQETQNLQGQVERRLDDAQEQCVTAGKRFLENPVNPEADPNGFAHQLGQALDLLESVRRAEAAFGLEPYREITELKEAIGRRLSEMKLESLDVSQLSARNTGRMISAMRTFGLQGLDKALETRADFLFREARNAYSEALAPCLQALESKDPGQVAEAAGGLAALGDLCERVFKDLGGKFEARDGLDSLRKSLLWEAMKDMKAKNLAPVVRSLRSPEMTQFRDLIKVAGQKLGEGLARKKDGAETLERIASQGPLSTAGILEDLDQVLALKLSREGVPAPEQAEHLFDPVTNISTQALDALRQTFGLTRNEENKWVLAGSMTPVPDPLSTRVSSGVNRCLDALARKDFHSHDLIPRAFEISTRINARHPEMRDPGEIRRYVREKMRDALSRTPGEMLQRLHSRLTSERMMNLRHGLADAVTSGPETMDPVETDARTCLVSAGDTLDALEEALAETLAERRLPVSPPPEGSGKGPLTARNSEVFNTGLTQIKTWLRVPEHCEGRGPFQGPNLELLQRSFGTFPRGEQLTQEARNPSGNGVGVCKAFYGDYWRAHFSVEENGRSRTLFAGESREEKFENGMRDLREFCGDDPALVFRVSQFINQSVFEPGFLAMMYTQPQSPFAFPDGRTPMPLFHRNQVEYTLSRGQDGGVDLHAKTTFPTHGVMEQKDENSLPEDVAMDIQTSRVVLTVDLSIGRDGRFAVKSAGYGFEMNRSVNLAPLV